MAEAAAEPQKKSGMMGMILVMVGVTVIAAGGGFGVAQVLIGRLKQTTAAAAAATSNAEEKKQLPYAGDTEVKEIPPLITNLSQPFKTEIRLQVSVVYLKKSVPDPALLIATLGQDFIAYMKTLSLAQIQGASGLQNLRDDLTERASIRSQGSVKEVIIEALITR